MIACTVFVDYERYTTTVVSAVLVRMWERVEDDAGNEYDYMWNALWLTVITMTTVGYGK